MCLVEAFLNLFSVGSGSLLLISNWLHKVYAYYPEKLHNPSQALLPPSFPPSNVRDQQNTKHSFKHKGKCERGSCLQIKELWILRKCFLTYLRVIWVSEKFFQKLKWIVIGVRGRKNKKCVFLFCDFFSLHCILVFLLSPLQSPSFLLPPFEWGFYTKDSRVWSLKPQDNNIQK